MLGAFAGFAAHRRDRLHGGVVHRRIHEADAATLDALGDLFRLQFDVRAQGFEHVGGARFRGHAAVAVLGDFRTRRRNDEDRRGRDVERMRAIATGTDDVDEMRAIGDFYRAREFAQHCRRARDFTDGFLLHPQPGEDRRGHRGGNFAAHDLPHQIHHFVVEDLAVLDGALEGFLRGEGHGSSIRGSAS
jgi:hypothetical protein